MKALFWVGIVALVLGILSLVVAIPYSEREGFKAGGLSVGIETRHEEKVSPFVSAMLIVGGAGMIFAAKRKSRLV